MQNAHLDGLVGGVGRAAGEKAAKKKEQGAFF
jgi:hypothetical protein